MLLVIEDDCVQQRHANARQVLPDLHERFDIGRAHRGRPAGPDGPGVDDRQLSAHPPARSPSMRDW